MRLTVPKKRKKEKKRLTVVLAKQGKNFKHELAMVSESH